MAGSDRIQRLSKTEQSFLSLSFSPNSAPFLEACLFSVTYLIFMYVDTCKPATTFKAEFYAIRADDHDVLSQRFSKQRLARGRSIFSYECGMKQVSELYS